MAVNNQRIERTPQIGEVYLMKFSGSGSEQVGWRPGLVFQNNVGNSFSPNIIALPLTSSIKKVGQPTHVLVKASDNGLKKDSMVLCENPQRMSKENVGRYIGRLTDSTMREVTAANLLATAAISYLDVVTLVSAWSKAVELNAVALA